MTTAPPSTPTKADAPEPLRLHIGGEEVKEGWKIYNVQQLPGVDYIGNALDLSQFADGSVTEVYGSHIYEHLDYVRELPIAFKEVFRVLRPSGLFRLGVPDIEVLARLIIDPRLSFEEKWHVQRMIIGGQTNPWDYHKVGFTFDFLKYMLEATGFRHVRRVQTFNLFRDATVLAFKGVPISLNVQALKP
ncbi:MAG TPA: methyltransferase domain-containing protein [Phycisphaerales bacterium]|nr:methyltransferase domain-containing protein [Phycisphaerales bacterium]